MSLLIQNMACIEVNLDPNSHRFYFNEDALKSCDMIEDIFLFFDYRVGLPVTSWCGNPFSQQLTDNNSRLTYIHEVENSGMFLNISDNEKEIISNLFFKQIISTPSKIYNSLLLNLNKKINSSKSYLNYTINAPVRFLCYITYTNKPKTHNTENAITGSFSVKIKPNSTLTYQDIKLSDVVPFQKKNLKIKRVSAFGFESFLYLKGENNLIENIPIYFLLSDNPKTAVDFDNMMIDYEQSFLKYRSPISLNREITLTFYY